MIFFVLLSSILNDIFYSVQFGLLGHGTGSCAAKCDVHCKCNTKQFIVEQTDFCLHVVLTSASDHAIGLFGRDSARARERERGPSFFLSFFLSFWVGLGVVPTCDAFSD